MLGDERRDSNFRHTVRPENLACISKIGQTTCRSRNIIILLPCYRELSFIANNVVKCVRSEKRTWHSLGPSKLTNFHILVHRPLHIEKPAERMNWYAGCLRQNKCARFLPADLCLRTNLPQTSLATSTPLLSHFHRCRFFRSIQYPKVFLNFSKSLIWRRR